MSILSSFRRSMKGGTHAYKDFNNQYNKWVNQETAAIRKKTGNRYVGRDPAWDENGRLPFTPEQQAELNKIPAGWEGGGDAGGWYPNPEYAKLEKRFQKEELKKYQEAAKLTTGLRDKWINSLDPNTKKKALAEFDLHSKDMGKVQKITKAAALTVIGGAAGGAALTASGVLGAGGLAAPAATAEAGAVGAGTAPTGGLAGLESVAAADAASGLGGGGMAATEGGIASVAPGATSTLPGLESVAAADAASGMGGGGMAATEGGIASVAPGATSTLPGLESVAAADAASGMGGGGMAATEGGIASVAPAATSTLPGLESVAAADAASGMGGGGMAATGAGGAGTVLPTAGTVASAAGGAKTLYDTAKEYLPEGLVDAGKTVVDAGKSFADWAKENPILAKSIAALIGAGGGYLSRQDAVGGGQNPFTGVSPNIKGGGLKGTQYAGQYGQLMRYASGGPVVLEDGGFVMTKRAVDGAGGPKGIKSILPAAKHVRGPGTGTSDSIEAIIHGKGHKIPARVSNGEAVVPRHQVQRVGGAAKLQAIMKQLESKRARR